MMTTSSRVYAFAFASLLLVTPSASAEEPSRPPLLEPLLAESATDVDARERGEVESEAMSRRLLLGGWRATLGSNA